MKKRGHYYKIAVSINQAYEARSPEGSCRGLLLYEGTKKAAEQIAIGVKERYGF